MERQVIDMNMKTMDGLIGARMNIDMMDVPIRVYKEARLKGDTATMERAMDYAGKCSDKKKCRGMAVRKPPMSRKQNPTGKTARIAEQVQKVKRRKKEERTQQRSL